MMTTTSQDQLTNLLTIQKMEEMQHEMAKMSESIKNRPPPVVETGAIQQLAEIVAHVNKPFEMSLVAFV